MKTAVLSALALAAAAGTASAQTLETRILVQTITGSGAGRQVTTTNATSFAQGATVRLTVQYRFTGLAANQGALLGSFLFSLNGTVNSGGAGTIARSFLTTQNPNNTGATTTNAESRVAIDLSGLGQDTADGPEYTQVNTSTTQSGLHNAGGNLRGLLSGGADTASANGTIVGVDINNILAGSSAASFTPFDGNDNPLGGSWLGLYSAEYTSNAGGASNVSFNIVKDPAAAVRWYTGFDVGSGGNVNMPGGAFNAGQPITLQFGSSDTAPTVTPVNIVGSPNFTPAPDINAVLIGTVSDPDGILASGVSAAVQGAAPTNTPVFTFNQLDANTVQVFVTYEIANADLAGGPSFFNVKIDAVDGPGSATGTARVDLVPAPGAAALLGLGGLLAARRRRQA